MSHLIPQQRVNKNGVPVIKHVLPPASGPASKQAIPAPQTATPATEDWAATEPLVYSQIALRTDSPDDVIARIGGFDPSLRKQISDAILSGDDYSSYVGLTLMDERDEAKIRYIIGSLSFHRAITIEHAESQSVPLMYMRSSLKGLTQRFSIEYFGYAKDEMTDERLRYFKADIVSDTFNFRHKYPVNFERYAALKEIADNIDLVEKALPAMVQANSAIRHWRQENRESTDAGAMGAEDLLAIANVVKDRPDSAGYFYPYVRSRGAFDPEGFIVMIDTASPALYEGVL